MSAVRDEILSDVRALAIDSYHDGLRDGLLASAESLAAVIDACPPVLRGPYKGVVEALQGLAQKADTTDRAKAHARPAPSVVAESTQL